MFLSLQSIFPNSSPGPQILSQVLLVLIDFYKTQNESIAEVVALKEKLNNNDIKVEVLSRLLDSDAAQTGNILPVEKTPLHQPQEEEDEEVLQSANEQLAQEQERSQQLETELKNLRARNAMIQKEIKKNQDTIRLMEAENFDSRIVDLMNQVNEIEEEIALFTA